MAIDPQELERQFAELVEQVPAQRADALRALSLRDTELAARLALLLDAHQADTLGLDALRSDSLRRLGGFDATELIDRELGGWTLTAELGRGGMGVVYAGERERDGVCQHAAIKLLSVPVFDAEAGQRFVREAAVLARLDHPGICRLRDFGRSDEGWPYLVLDLIDGEPIATAAARLPMTRRIEFIAQVAEAVGAAHRQLVVHLDIKPDNILIDGRGQPVLLDFGVSRVLTEEGAGATATLTRWLTPDYASPEQLRGEPATVAADLYALGAVLYELVVGRPPFDLTRLSVTEALRQIERGAPMPSRLASGVPGDLDAVIGKAMHADARRRYASADAFAEDLRAVLARRPVAARPDSAAYRLRKLVQRNPIAAPATVLALVAITVLAILLAVQANDLTRQRDRAEREAVRARAVTDLLIGSIRAADPTGVQSGTTDLNTLMEATSRRMHLELAEQPDLLAEGLIGIADARRAMGQHALAIQVYDESIGLMNRAGMDLGEQLGAKLGRLESLYHSEAFDEAIDGAEALLPQVTPTDRWRVLGALGNFRIATGDLDDAEQHLRAAMEAVPPEAEDEYVHVLRNLGAVQQRRGNLPEALAEYQRALAVLEAAESARPDTEATVRLNLAHMNARVGDAESALADAERALAIRLELFGETHHLIVETLGFQAVVLTELARYDEAIAAAQRAIAIERALPGGGETLLAAQQYKALGSAQWRGEYLSKAEQTLRRTLELYLLHLPSDHLEVAFVHNELAAVYSGLGDYARALDEMLLVWAVYRDLSPDQPTVVQSLIASNVADVYAKLEQGEPGIEWSRRALEIAGATLPAEHWYVGNMRSVYAANLLLSGDLDSALSEASAGETLFVNSSSPVQPNMIRENYELLTRVHEARGDLTAADTYRDKLSQMPSSTKVEEGSPTE